MPWAQRPPLDTGAAESDTSDDWRYAATVYLWNAEIDGQSETRSDVNVDFPTLRANCNVAFMGAFDA